MEVPKLESLNKNTIREKYISIHYPEFHTYIVEHHPYDPNNREDQEVVNFWKSKGTEFYDNAIKVWTESDLFKRKVAKENGLNWVEIFSCNLDDVITLYETF